jgi:2-methylisocitrate lyase-like PEP mutase family enzyme
MPEHQEKFDCFKSMHERGTAFVVANAWDAGSARLLSVVGFEALATTSAGYAFSKGKRDSFASLSREEVIENASEIVRATDLPVTADLEDGFGASPEECGETVRLASDVGLAGGSIEDATGNPDDPIYETGLAADRIRAAAEATRNRPFLLTARAENFLWGRPDLADTIARLQAFSEAGADVLYAPGLPDIEAIRSVCSAVDKPVNVVMGLQGTGYTMEDLSRAGVARVSVGGSFARAALGALMDAAREVKQKGTFNYAMSAIPDAVVSQYMDQGTVQKRT